MSTSRNFKPLTPAEPTDADIASFAERRGVPALKIAEPEAETRQPVPAPAQPALATRLALEVPLYLADELKIRAIKDRCSTRYANHACVNGTHDYLRLNLYLTQHGEYVCIWWGLLDPSLAELRFSQLASKLDLHFRDIYIEDLFRGYIRSPDQAAVIMDALRVGSHIRYEVPQVLSGAPDELRCDCMDAVTE